MACIGRIGTALTVGLAAAFALGGCNSASHTQVEWQPEGTPRHTHHTEDWWQYQYVYHPNVQVYFEPYSETYFWFENGQWHEGAELPKHITLDPEWTRVVKLKSPKPHSQHATVVAQHGPQKYRAYPASPFESGESHASGMQAGVDPEQN